MLSRIVKHFLKPRKIGSLAIGRDVTVINKGSISSGKSYMADVVNLTVNLITANDRKSFILNEGTLVLGTNVRIHKGFGIHIGKNATLSIGDNSYINPESVIVCHTSINIGSDCVISWHVELLDDDLHSITWNDKTCIRTSAIVIEDHVWIGSGVKILKGTHIGKGAVIAAGSVVSGKVEAHCLYGGIPAKKIRENINWE